MTLNGHALLAGWLAASSQKGTTILAQETGI